MVEIAVKSAPTEVSIFRFITYSCYYWVYLVFICMVTAVPDFDEENNLTFGVFHWGLGVYGVAFLYRDLVLMLSRKSIRTFFKFWRIYDLLMHIMLFTGILMRYLTYQDIQHFLHDHVLGGTGFEERAVKNSLVVSRILLSLTATLSLNR